MKEFLMILFFSKSILLTPEPINIDGTVELVPEEKLTAITPGASIHIDVTSIIKKDAQEGILEFRKRVSNMFPPGSITATLSTSSGAQVVLSYSGGSEFNSSGTWLSLYSDNGVPTGVDFESVKLTSALRLEGVKVTWKNYKQ